MSNKMNIVGIGPGAREYLTLKALDVIENSDVLVGSKRSLDLFNNTNAEMVVLEPRDIPKTIKKAVSYLEEGFTVTVLSTGDPGFSGMLKTIKKLSPNTKVNVLPGISSIQLAAAKLEIPWDTANLLTIHGGKAPTEDLLDKLDNSRPNIILPNRHISELAEYLIDHGFSPEHGITICEKLSYPDEQIVHITLEEAKQMDFGYMCVVVI
ncbi:cobalt-precorrin-7 (C(5))-methyltransferase [Candidatus Methanosphaera massiliense]|nr:cobalt-precorrin-7 (C(5))-methyltransferase [Candidatus Methanosphaera massiliense]MDD6285981.1 cobalt-precorrin-7 (C(5))-methyltransferase [Methanobacteriaceae archaeon]MDE4077854.1 cobalt-precorrin-7 (C(5))-methyltransferase [Candidatus Methanosphaera massiliense]RAP43864.1 MAG: precorrin-6y C5,15-methyltransferase (decarboxylating) subunit CbiE [Methanosphaera sp. SHI1033]